MKASITISQADIETVVAEYVKKYGWIVSGQVRLSHNEDSDRGISSTMYSATVDVRPSDPKP